MKTKLITVLAAGALFAGGIVPLVANANDVDPWEDAAKKYLAGQNNDGGVAPQPAPAAPEAPKKDNPVEIDEKYVKDNIDTPTGKESKDKEDAYYDAAEAKYKAELENQKGKQDGKKQFKKLPKTSAVK